MADAKRTCTFPECGREHKAHGLCGGHYYQYRKGDELYPLFSTRVPPHSRPVDAKCSIEGCETRRSQGSLCRRHARERGPRCTFEQCGKHRYGRGLCRGHYEQAANGKPLTPLRPVSSRFDRADERLARQTDRTGDCWNWTGSISSGGYGTLTVHGLFKYAHRLAWELDHGPIPDGLVIDHKCRNRRCVRPDHLHVVTTKENAENTVANCDSATGIRGVSWNERSQKWRVQVKHFGRTYTSSHVSLAEAERAAVALRNDLYTNNLQDR